MTKNVCQSIQERNLLNNIQPVTVEEIQDNQELKKGKTRRRCKGCYDKMTVTHGAKYARENSNVL